MTQENNPTPDSQGSLTFCKTLSALRGEWTLLADSNFAVTGSLAVRRRVMSAYYAEPVSTRREKARGRFHFSLNYTSQKTR